MPKDSFQEAKDNLIPLDIYLRETTLELDKGYNPKYHPEQFEIQHRREIVSLVQATLTEEDGSESNTHNIFSVTYALGVRLVQIDSHTEKNTTKETKSKNAAEPLVVAELTANFIAEYKVKKEGLEKEALAMFAERNTLYHIWPYWREYVSSTVTRARLPAIPLPTIQV